MIKKRGSSRHLAFRTQLQTWLWLSRRLWRLRRFCLPKPKRRMGKTGRPSSRGIAPDATHSTTIMKVPALGRGGKNSGHGQKLFQYSEALKNTKHRSDEGTLDKWLTDTKSVVPDNGIVVSSSQARGARGHHLVPQESFNSLAPVQRVDSRVIRVLSPILKSSIKRSNSTPREQLALCDVAADRSQAPAKHDLGTGRPIGQVQWQDSHRWGVILAGGDGKRLLPLTRRITGNDRPKQFCALTGGKTLLKQTQRKIIDPNRTPVPLPT
jgi:hypothetical protein